MRRTSFEEVCHRVRFSLDEPGSTADEGSNTVADFVAKVRSEGLQVTRTTVPRIAGVVERVCARVGLEGLAETYILNDPSCNAFVPVGASTGRPIVVLTSGLVTLLDINEISFAVGHEIGHCGFGHSTRDSRGSAEYELEALSQRSALRYAEVSADRIGLLATASVFVAARAIIKLASGLPAEFLGLDVDAFVKQAERDPDELSREWELNSTHPSLPLRMWALICFAHSSPFAELSGQGRGGRNLEEVDKEIEKRLAGLGDGRLTEVEQNTYELALVWAALALALEKGRIDSRDRAALVRLVGTGKATKALQFLSSNGKAAVMEKLSKSLERLNGAGVATRRRFLNQFSEFSYSASNFEGKTTNTAQVVRDALGLP